MLTIETGKDNPILRTICDTIRTSEMKQYTKLWREMVKYIRNPQHSGVWLAAPQVWVKKRIIVVSLLKDWEDEHFSTVMMINPEILEHSQTTDIENEWCLSLPKQRGNVRRWTDIKLAYIDEKGKQKILRLSGVSARIVQHEIDHLDGVLFIDKLEA